MRPPTPSLKASTPRPACPSQGQPDSGALASALNIVMDKQRVAAIAREIWIAKGRPVGLDEQNWLEAEAQLKKKEL